MKRQSLAIPLIGALALIFATSGYTAAPRKSATYMGDIKSTPFSMHVTIVVAPTGKGLVFTYRCGTGRAPTTVRGIPVDATGHFAFTSGHQDWKVAGRFPTATTAFVSLSSIACGGSKGSTTLRLRT